MANFKFYSKKDNKEVFEAKSLTEDKPKTYILGDEARVEIEVGDFIYEGILKKKK